MPPGRLPLEVFRARGQTQNPLEGIYISSARERLRIPQEELESVAGEKEAWGALLSRLPPGPE